MTPEARFVEKVRKTNTCWWWTASRVNGYGQFRLGGTMMGAHRFAYELWVGPIPEGMTLDHLCRNRGCVNPAHLDPCTQRENKERSPLHGHAKKTCPAGHPYGGDNLYVDPRGHRHCRTCRRERYRRAAGVPQSRQRGAYGPRVTRAYQPAPCRPPVWVKPERQVSH